MTFSIRELATNTPYTATLIINGTPSSMVVIINDGSISKNSSVNGSIQLNQFDLITIQVSWTGGALSNGACISLIATKN
jgi:hypothetical protein